jgi:hypothetical protein
MASFLIDSAAPRLTMGERRKGNRKQIDPRGPCQTDGD